MPKTDQKRKAQTFRQDERKFSELLLYITTKSADDPDFGATKLNKLLFACDLLAYGTLGEPITGFRYVKRQFGPAPRRFTTIRDRLIDQRALAIEERFRGSHTQKRPVALRRPDLGPFTAAEMDLINSVLNDFRGVNATEISEWSHGLCGWAIANDDADIPYEAVFLSDLPMTAYEAEYGRHLALERSWNVF